MPDTKFDSPATYQITVRGELESILPGTLRSPIIEFVDRLTHLETVISVRVKDQAHLSSILNCLYDDRCTIIKVESAVSEKL